MYHVQHYRYRFWAVYRGHELIAVTVYKRGAVEVARRLNTLTATLSVKESRNAS